MKAIKPYLHSFLILLILTCAIHDSEPTKATLTPNLLNYSSNPTTQSHRPPLTFSDQGAWFAYGLPTDPEQFGGFSGAFLMSQENGVWCSPALSRLELTNGETGIPIDWSDFSCTQTSYNSHLVQTFKNERLKIAQTLFFFSPHTALITTKILNISGQSINLRPAWTGTIFLESQTLKQCSAGMTITSEKSLAEGWIHVPGSCITDIQSDDTSYSIDLVNVILKPGQSKELLLTHTFIFPEYDADAEQRLIEGLPKNHRNRFRQRVRAKERQLERLVEKMDPAWEEPAYRDLMAKAVLTLQNNWRIPAGELKHAGLFPSYHYEWFHGFWAWDSWKHAAALAHFHPDLAKDQIRAMFDFMDADGFITDCVYRDTTIEPHNLRNTKPPLSAWAAWKVYEQDGDRTFLEEIYPKIVKQHRWWYAHRDHDGDGLCEYGCTDGTLVAARWESGMDNAVRFDHSRILRNSEKAYSLDQESVDLNAYLYAEKEYLARMAEALRRKDEADQYRSEAEILKARIQSQFFDPATGWFYDTTIDGSNFIDVMGCEGWIPLWAGAASPEQAEAVKNTMMDPDHFFTHVPFQTLDASHPEFQPDGGYWRGPVWLDQAYFGVKGLHDYGFHREAMDAARKLIHNAEGVLARGPSIRENYHPLTGEGLEAENFSWSAAHVILLLMRDYE